MKSFAMRAVPDLGLDRAAVVVEQDAVDARQGRDGTDDLGELVGRLAWAEQPEASSRA